MKRLLVVAALFLLGLSVRAQQIQEQSLVVNVEVPVRVFKGKAFVDHLTIGDFEVFENGKPQKVEAAYLVKKRTIERREEEKEFSPQTSRNFFLFFEISEYMPRLGEALEHFVYDVIVPGDNIVIVTPVKTYRLLNEALMAKSKTDILSQLKGLLRRDAQAGTMEYRAILEDLERLARSLSQSIAAGRVIGEALIQLDNYTAPEYAGRTFDEQLQRYADLLSSLDNIRTVDQQKLLSFADHLKHREGQKHVFLFYEKEYIPRIDPKILYQYLDLYQDRPDIYQTVTGLFEFYRRDLTFNIDRIKQAFADSSISSYFLFIATPAKDITGVRLEEESDDIFSAFHQIAKVGGGFIESSANPVELMRNAVKAAENYYLLYYSPAEIIKDGRFREIRVRVKGREYRVVHRMGYIAR